MINFMADNSDTFSSYSVPRTKRFLYHILKRLLKIPRQVDKGDTRKSYTILGPRKVGKTTILQQLATYFKEESIYFDLSIIGYPIKFTELFSQEMKNGKKIILLDEISKVSEDCLMEFVSAVKMYCWGISFVMTGSTKASVSKINDMIGRASTFELPPIMYIERLAWEANVEVYDLAEYRRNITLDSFKSYVRYYALKPDADALGYVQSVVEDTMESIWRHNYLDEDNKNTLGLSSDIIWEILKYISLCQLVYALENKQYCLMPALTGKVIDAMGGLYQDLKSMRGMPKSAISDVCQMLVDSGLAIPLYVKYMTSDPNENLRSHSVDKQVSNIIFEYPWYASIAITDMLNEQELWGYWIENLLYLKMRYLYNFVDKYRAGTDEIDIVYPQSLQEYCGLECKFTPFNNIRHSTIKHYRQYAQQLGLKRMDITSTDFSSKIDSFTQIYKIQELIAVLELEYIKQCDQLEELWSPSVPTVYELMKKYGFI